MVYFGGDQVVQLDDDVWSTATSLG